MRETTLTVHRPEGTVIASGVPVQVDQTSLQEVIHHRQAYGWDGADLFKLYTAWWMPAFQLQRGDVVFDERFTDPETGALYKYRVIGRVRVFDRDHLECFAEVVVGA